MHTWARMALRLSDNDFKRAETDGYGQPWPIDYGSLVKYYDLVESFHGLRGANDGLSQLPDNLVSEHTELTEPAALFKRKVESKWPARTVIPPRVLRADIEPTPAPLQCALASKRLSLLANSPVARVLLNDAGDRARGVECVNTVSGERSIIRADKVFLCASSIESVRILLNSKTARHPGGIGNAYDQLGRYVLDHNLVVATGPTSREYHGLASAWEPREFTPLDLSSQLDFYIPDFTATLADRRFIRGFGIQGRISPTHWGMAMFGEMLPQADNRITVSHRKDKAGIPVANISLRRGENDKQMIRTQKQQLRAIAKAAGLEIKMPVPGVLGKVLWKIVGPEVGVMHLGIAIHETGGARMGGDPKTSVTNERNQIWQVPNLYVTDGACFPNTGCQNPTLTIMAVTARACNLAVEEG